jgi:hypothetical protein
MICRQLICILVYDQTCINALKSNNVDGSSACDGREVTINLFDTLLNYLLIIINVAAVSIHEQHHNAIPMASCISLAFVVAFQLCLCLFIADCVGVSIIWCSTFGWLCMCMLLPSSSSHMKSRSKQSTVARAVAFLDCGAIVFYAVVSDVIGTIAHCLAVILGILLWKWSFCSNKSRRLKRE